MWRQYDEDDSFDDDFEEVESSDDSFDVSYYDKRDPASSRKRQLSPNVGQLSPLPPRPKLKRVMSNSEKQVCFMDGFHVNDKKLTAVDMATPGYPDHTYSAVGFNIHSLPKGHVVRVKGFSVSGHMGRMRVYLIMNQQCHMYREDRQAWTCIYDQKHKSAWKKHINLMFDSPVIIPPCQNAAFYVHSDRQDDLGLKYRSCSDGIVHKDDYIAITRGFAHTSPIPFDPNTGWFREYRVLSGSVFYDALPIRWTNFCHDMFPQNFQHAIDLLRQSLVTEQEWHEHIVDNIIEFMPFDWFGQNIGCADFVRDVERTLYRPQTPTWGW